MSDLRRPRTMDIGMYNKKGAKTLYQDTVPSKTPACSSPQTIAYYARGLFLLLALFTWVSVSGAESGMQRIVIIGDSLTAGLGLPREDAYPAVLQRRLQSEGHAFTVVNAGISGDTSSGGLRRIDWLLKEPAKYVILALGANDGLRGIDTNLTKNNLSKMISRIRKKNSDTTIILAGMLVPPNMGEEYANKFRSVFPAVAAEQKVHLLPFLLEGVAAEPEKNQADGIHPNEEGQKIIAQNVWSVLQPLLQQSPAKN